jgi:anaerobic magnesium-protoporphyrin IX monomethyl ester cyclase
MAQLDHLIAKYDVGFISPATENFGNDKRWLTEFCREIKRRDVLWAAGAVRTKSVSPEWIAMMKDAGCVSLSYGMETGSRRILEIMEKKTSLEDNMNAQKWTTDAGLTTVVQLVLGMPGESPETIGETIEFVKYCFTLNPELNPNNLGINYAQALPGTPLYEFGRHKNLIGQSLDEEEEYLIAISDRDAHDEFTTLNFTDYPTLECQTWRPRITVEVNHAYVNKFGLDKYHAILLQESNFFQPVSEDDGYHANPKRLTKIKAVEDANPTADAMKEFNPGQNEIPNFWQLVRQRKLGLAMICYPVLIYRFRWLLPLLVLYKNLQRFSLEYNLRLVKEYIAYKLARRFTPARWRFGSKSLRKIMDHDLGELATDLKAMEPLRRGR